MPHIIEISETSRIIVAPLLLGRSKKVFQSRTGNGQWKWDGSVILNETDTETLLIQHGKMCPECKSDTDRRGRCTAQCNKRG